MNTHKIKGKMRERRKEGGGGEGATVHSVLAPGQPWPEGLKIFHIQGSRVQCFERKASIQ